MKTILTEIVLSGGAIVFWALALPAAAIIFPVAEVGSFDDLGGEDPERNGERDCDNE